MKILCGAALIAATLPMASAGEGKVMTWMVDGVKRAGIVYAPKARSSNGKAPVVLVFHGHGDTAANFQGVRLQDAYREAVVVYFQGLPSSRDGEPGWQNEAGRDGDRDLHLVDDALAALHKAFPIDDARVYATGFSNGGRFTYLLWAERPQTFAAYASVAGLAADSLNFKQPRPFMHVGGENDRTNAFELQLIAMERARQANGANGNGSACHVDRLLEGIAHCTEYAGKAPVVTVIHPGGHVFPDGTSQQIAEFFRSHSLSN